MGAVSWCILGVQAFGVAPLWRFRSPGLCHRGLPARSLRPWRPPTMSSGSGPSRDDGAAPTPWM